MFDPQPALVDFARFTLYFKPDHIGTGTIEMTVKYLSLVAVLTIFSRPALADDMELYCEGRHNDGAGAPVVDTHLWLRLTKRKDRYVIELQGPEFEKSSLLADESPTELKASEFTDGGSIEHQIVLNRQTLRLNYSVRTSSEVNHEFSGICRSYSPKI